MCILPHNFGKRHGLRIYRQSLGYSRQRSTIWDGRFLGNELWTRDCQASHVGIPTASLLSPTLPRSSYRTPKSCRKTEKLSVFHHSGFAVVHPLCRISIEVTSRVCLGTLIPHCQVLPHPSRCFSVIRDCG